ncbi:hypothetical protein DHW03_09770 [Pedobacter yonginense]|uniref:Uncharacterized protein n=1 Tax=Pedobacter yonginense TaxID=651869 RepID=A0A317EMQ9_9SPHI|nr:hypothetical protein [Pedobacter yonginense]PWS27852.1 hypothetical protein DHW03_09770 [Pedobacter yonginense]
MERKTCVRNKIGSHVLLLRFGHRASALQGNAPPGANLQVHFPCLMGLKYKALLLNRIAVKSPQPDFFGADL